jgi:hypothetical protein
MRTDEEIDSFIKDLTKGYDNVQRRLESILLRSLSEEELERTRNKIKELKSELIQQENDLLAARKAFEMMEDTSLKRATQNRSNSITDLFSEEEEIDGIEVFSNNNKNNDEPETELEKERYAAALRRKQLSLVLAGKMKPSEATELKALFME